MSPPLLDDDDDLGRGPINPEDIEYVVRRLRHRVISMGTAQKATIELLQVINGQVTAHHSDLSNRIGTLEGRTYGYRDDTEGGAIGRINRSLGGLRKQNWSIILAVITAALGLAIEQLVAHH